MKVLYQPGDFFSSAPVQPPNLFGVQHVTERVRMVEYLREIADKIEDCDLMVYTLREGSDVIGFEVL